ncbi:MAG: hypothetical protein ACRCW1_01770 [Anaerotignaceae bacterium]
MEKNKIFIFFFSFMPGAGEMYLNMMNKGIIIMGAMFGVGFVVGSLNFQSLLFFIPLIWFYSFFDTHNMKALTLEERLKEDELFTKKVTSIIGKDASKIFKNKGKLIGKILLIMVAYVAFNLVMDILISALEVINEQYVFINLIYRVRYIAPNIIVTFILYIFAIKLIKGDKKEEEKEFIEFNSDDLDN